MIVKLIKVSGDSLYPEYEHGDFVLISKIPFYLYSPAAGDVIAFRQPGYGVMIKRIQAILPEGTVEVRGSHPDSVDSRVFGEVAVKNILGKVIWHIHKG